MSDSFFIEWLNTIFLDLKRVTMKFSPYHLKKLHNYIKNLQYSHIGIMSSACSG